jgi:nucleoside-diphosphate-sugar epimerase
LITDSHAFQPSDPQKELVDPALLGTLNVLRSVEKTGRATVKRVVLTSSIAAVAGKRPEGHVYTVRMCVSADACAFY